MQAYMKYKTLDLKIQSCQYAFQTYKHILNDITNCLRSGDALYAKLHYTDSYLIDNTPFNDKFLKL